MKKNILPELFSGFFYAFSITAGAVFCPITAFSITVEPFTLLVGIALLSLAFSACMTFRRWWLGAGAVFALLVAFLIYRRAELLGGFWLCAEAVVPVFSEAFSLGRVFVLPEGMAFAMSADVFFLLLSALIAFLCALSIVRMHGCALCFAAALPPLVFCLIILETVPGTWALVLLAGALALALVTGGLRRADPAAGRRAGRMLVIPLAGLLAVLCLLFPEERYERPEFANSLQSGVSRLVDGLSVFRRNERTGQVELVSPFTPSTLGARSWDSSVTKADLSRIGPQTQTGRHVMDVLAPVTGVYHLRASSLGIYEDNTWKSIEDTAFSDIEVPSSVFLNEQIDAAQTLSVTIRTDMRSAVCYLPYRPVELPENTRTHTDAYVENRLQSTEYVVQYAAEPEIVEQNDAYLAFVYETYTQLPDELRAALGALPEVQWIAKEPFFDTRALAESVGALVREGKAYSLETVRMPSDEEFVLWFLEQSETGYCVHFSTAAAVILRWCGVPARYVTGYYVSATEGQWTAVTEDDAHAWVEYFDGAQWRVLDPTPASFRDSVENGEESELSAPEVDETPTNLPEEPEKNTPDPSEHPTQTTPVGGADSPRDVDTKEPEGQGRGWLWWVLAALAFAGAWLLYRALRLGARRAQLAAGSTNRRAVLYYRHIRLLARRAGAEIPSKVEELALRAKYSRHRLSDGELAVLTDCAEELTARLRQETRFWRRFVDRMIYALY